MRIGEYSEGQRQGSIVRDRGREWTHMCEDREYSEGQRQGVNSRGLKVGECVSGCL